VIRQLSSARKFYGRLTDFRRKTSEYTLHAAEREKVENREVIC
jgi:hypothetical protein